MSSIKLENAIKSVSKRLKLGVFERVSPQRAGVDIRFCSSKFRSKVLGIPHEYNDSLSYFRTQTLPKASSGSCSLRRQRQEASSISNASGVKRRPIKRKFIVPGCEKCGSLVECRCIRRSFTDRGLVANFKHNLIVLKKRNKARVTKISRNIGPCKSLTEINQRLSMKKH